jgi:hypothetical protein
VDVADRDFGQAIIARLDELRLLATESRIDADLRTGVTATLVAVPNQARRDSLSCLAYPISLTATSRRRSSKHP